ncbi:AMP-binding protein [Pseudooceanicola aestuarii]|uniref:AMP-binding protein n=1 Tax=Pseudooceanicola aestuarii TaxID=2697319 RepID=UPI0013D57708|nr:AMP-binding protein [Pseudooceanicola aestuarii]
MTATPQRPWQDWYAPGATRDFVPERDTIAQRVHGSFLTHGPILMVEYFGEEITYAQMHGRVSQAARALTAAGVKKGDRIALHLPNCPWHPVLFLGAMWIGASVTHLSPLDATAELAHKITDSGAAAVFSLSTPELSEKLLPLLADGTCPTLYLCPDPVSAQGRDCPIPEGAHPVEDLLAGQSDAPMAPAADVTPDDLALLQYTGGTTGVPKAAMLTQGNLSASQQMYTMAFTGEPSAVPGSRGLYYSPLFHIMGLCAGMLKRAVEGGSIYLRPRFDAARAVAEVEKFKIEYLTSVPTGWIAILGTPGVEDRDLSSLSYIGSGGAPLPSEVFLRVERLTGLKLRGGWGMTETAAAGTTVPANMPEDKLGSIGIPTCGLDLKIVDVDDPSRDLPVGEAGEMAVRGPNVTSGYWNRSAEENAACYTPDGYLLTGDIGYMDADGWFFVVDRKKDLILSGGFNVYPLTIENAIHQHPAVLEAMVIGVPDDYRGESAKAFVVLNPGAEAFTLEEMQAFLADKLGRHEIPRHLEFRTDLPRTVVGKASRRALRDEEDAKVKATQGV